MNGGPAADHLGKTAGKSSETSPTSWSPSFNTCSPRGSQSTSRFPLTFPARTEVGHWILHYLPIKNATGAVNRIGVLVVEITAQRKLEKSLRDADRKLHIEMDRLQMLLEVTNILSSNWNVQQVFPRISARIRRVLHQECATFASYDAATGLLVRQAVDFPLARGFTDHVQIVASNSPAGRSLHEHTPMIFSTEQLQTLTLTSPGVSWRRGCDLYVASLFFVPKVRLACWSSAALAKTLFSQKI